MKKRSNLELEPVIGLIEDHLEERLGLDRVAELSHYSKYYLHRAFSGAFGMTIHDYIRRRQLTEGARLLTSSEKTILEIALGCGYESQQAFSAVFKAMYKKTPAQYRKRGTHYALQLPLKAGCEEKWTFDGSDIRPAERGDVEPWMRLVDLSAGGYPMLDEEEYRGQLEDSIRKERALILRKGETVLGAMLFSDETGCIQFMGVHPRCWNQGIPEMFLKKLKAEYIPGREVSTTTFRNGDPADNGQRNIWKLLGFREGELLEEYGYPTQRLVLPPGAGEGRL